MTFVSRIGQDADVEGEQDAFIPAQWPEPRIHHWRTLMMARAIENQVFMVASNRVGVEEPNIFVGGSMVVDPWGQILAELRNGEESIVEASIDFEVLQDARRTIPVLQDRRLDIYK